MPKEIKKYCKFLLNARIWFNNFINFIVLIILCWVIKGWLFSSNNFKEIDKIIHEYS